MISIVIPLYNKAPYVEQALRSALCSADVADEVIVVDDGSTDDGPQRVAALSDPRVRLVAQPNRGVSAARNRGIDEARGDYIAFLDADDCWSERYLPEIRRLISRFPGCGMYATHFYRFRDGGGRQVHPLRGVRAGAQRIDRFFELWSGGDLFCTCSVVIPRRVLDAERVRFPEGEQHGEDQEVWFRIAERWPLAYFPEPLVGYRVGVQGSLAASFAADALPCMERLAARYRAHAIAERHRKGVARVLSVTRLTIARHLLIRGERRRAIVLLYDPQCLRSPRYWLRLFLAAHMPKSLGRHLIP